MQEKYTMCARIPFEFIDTQKITAKLKFFVLTKLLNFKLFDILKIEMIKKPKLAKKRKLVNSR